MSLGLLEQLDRHAAGRPDDVAIRHATIGASPHESITWAALREAVRRTSSALAGRVPAGGVVLLCAPNRAEFTVAFLAGLRAGLRVFPVSPSLTPAELRAAAGQSNARAIAGTAEANEAVRDIVPAALPIDAVFPATGSPVSTVANSCEPAPPRDPAAAALLLHSSGTTGLPKIVVRTGRSLDAVARAMAEAIRFRPDDQVLACVPLCHSYGVEHGLLAPLWAGSTVRLCQGFEVPMVLHELEQGATIFPGVPFVYEMVAKRAGGRRFPRLRRAYSAGGPLPDAVADACRDELGVTVSQLYGATEIGSVTYADPDLPGFGRGSVGRAMRGVDVRILPPDANAGATSAADSHAADNPPAAEAAGDGPAGVGPPPPAGTDGQVAVRADSMFAGYLDGSPAPLSPAGYFLTGDLGRLDAHGNLTITGRLKLLIDVGGLKVNPLEVEAALAEHPAVSACVVVPLPVTQTVSRLKAIVVARPAAGARRQTPRAAASAAGGEQLRQFLRDRLAPYKVPRVIEFRDDLPRSPAGKVLRQQVRA